MKPNLLRRHFLGVAATSLALNSRGTASPANLLGADSFHGVAGSLPEGWRIHAPNPALAPKFQLAKNTQGAMALSAEGNGRRECFGYVSHPASLEPGKTYRMRVEFHMDGLEDVGRQLLHGFFGKNFNDGVFEYSRSSDLIVGEKRFPGPDKRSTGEVRLYFRFSPRGRVFWNTVRLEECEALASRLVTIASRQGALPNGAGLSYWEEWLDAAGRRKVDVALLPEMFNGKDPVAAESLDGPAGNLLLRKAKQWGMHTSASFYEKRGDLVYNTAPLFDRQGKLLGTYEKVYPYDPELDKGVTPGSRFPVFQTDFGKVGIMICYDSWFPETARTLALNGAEVILFPSAGYYVDLMAARTADNGVCIAASSLNCPAGLWDSSGARAGEASPSATRFVKSAIQSHTEDAALGMVVATVDLSPRYSPHWWGGPMASAPGGRRVRRTSIGSVEDEVARQAHHWWVG